MAAMVEEVFLGIVPNSGSQEPLCSGLFKFDPVKGYEGNLLVPFGTPKAGDNLFELPTALKGKTLYCIADGSNFATILWPDFSGGHSIKNFASRIIHLKVRQLLKGIHIGADENEVCGIWLSSPILARFFRLQAFKTEIETSPLKVTIQTLKHEEKSFNFSFGKLSVGVSGSYSPEGEALAPSLKANSYLALEFRQPINPIESLKYIRRIEHLLSLLAFDFIKAERVSLRIECADSQGKKEKEHYELERAKLLENAKTQIERHEVAIDLTEIDFGAVLDKFEGIFAQIEQTLNWYRIVAAEDRYLEDKFFYCVRMIESLYRILNIATEPDKPALDMVSSICDALKGSSTEIEFLQKRVVPIFNKPASLPRVIKDLKTRYKEVLSVEILDEKVINKLRSKEAHGSAERFSGYEYAFMSYCYDLLRFLYVLTILEKCGLERDYLLNGAKKTLSLSRHFSDEMKHSLAKVKETSAKN
jgi:hypothetical protein